MSISGIKGDHGNKGRPAVSKLLKPFGLLWGTSQVESNSIDRSGYAFEDTCRNFWTIFVVFLPLSIRYFTLKIEEYFRPEKIRTLFVHSGQQTVDEVWSTWPAGLCDVSLNPGNSCDLVAVCWTTR